MNMMMCFVYKWIDIGNIKILRRIYYRHKNPSFSVDIPVNLEFQYLVYIVFQNADGKGK